MSIQKRAISAVVREDGTVYFDQQASKPTSVQLLDWTLAFLWLAAGAVLVAALISI
jgi:hypothetical protein